MQVVEETETRLSAVTEPESMTRSGSFLPQTRHNACPPTWSSRSIGRRSHCLIASPPTPRSRSTTLRFVHSGWREVTDFCASCNAMWGNLMFRLKDSVEGHGRGPQWT